jgi:hypothetical protein
MDPVLSGAASEGFASRAAMEGAAAAPAPGAALTAGEEEAALEDELAALAPALLKTTAAGDRIVGPENTAVPFAPVASARFPVWGRRPSM